MDKLQALAKDRDAAARGDPKMVFDWDKCVQIIKDKKPHNAIAGLAEEFEWSSGLIFEKGKPKTDQYVYLASIWTQPTLQIEIDSLTMKGVTEFEQVECWRLAEDVPEWDARTIWPKSALDILEAKE